MRLLIQRVKSASVEVEGEIVGEIRKGLLVFLGVKDSDDGSEIPRLAKKLVGLRIFEDDNDKMNLSVKDIQGEILSASQYTLYADCSKGNRPGFSAAAPAKKALEFYEKFISESEIIDKCDIIIIGAPHSLYSSLDFSNKELIDIWQFVEKRK